MVIIQFQLHFSVRNLIMKLNKLIFFSVFINSTMQGYLNFTISTLLSVTNVNHAFLTVKINFEHLPAALTSLVFVFYVSVMPFLAFALLRCLFTRLNNQGVQDRIGAFYLILKTERFSYVMHSILFFVRRLVFSLSIIFAGDYPLLQAGLQVECSLLLLIYMLYVKPFKDKWIFYFQVFNEATLLSCSYFLLVLCDILMDNNLRSSVGWYMVAVTLLNIMVNWLNLVISLVVDLIKLGIVKYKKWQLKRQQQADKVQKLPLKYLDDNSNMQSFNDLRNDETFIANNQSTMHVVEQDESLISISNKEKRRIKKKKQIKEEDKKEDLAFDKIIQELINGQRMTYKKQMPQNVWDEDRFVIRGNKK